MASISQALPKVVAGLEFARPRNQDANFNLLQHASAHLASSAQHQQGIARFSQTFSACQAPSPTHQAHVQWDALHRASTQMMSHLQAFLSSTSAPAYPAAVVPNSTSLADILDGSLASLYCSLEVSEQKCREYSACAPRRPPKRVASQSCEQPAAAKRYALCPQASRQVRGLTTTTASTPNWPEQHTYSIQPSHPSQENMMDESATTAIVASWCQSLSQVPSNTWDVLSSSQLNAWPQCPDSTAIAQPIAATHILEGLGRSAQCSTGEVLYSDTAAPDTSDTLIAHLQQQAGCTLHSVQEHADLCQQRQLPSAGYDHSAAMHDAHDQMSMQCPPVGDLEGAPICTDVMACLMNAASAHSQLAQLHTAMCMTSAVSGGALVVADPVNHIIPVPTTALNSADSVRTVQPLACDPFSYLQPAATTQCRIVEAGEQSHGSQACVPVHEVMHAQEACLPPIPEVQPEMFAATLHDACTQPEAFEQIQQHDAFMSQALAPIRICKSDSSGGVSTTQRSTGVPLATSAAVPVLPPAVLPVHALAVPALDVVPVTTGIPAASMGMLQATAAALGLLELLQPVQHVWQPDAATVPTLPEPQMQVQHAAAAADCQDGLQGWGWNGYDGNEVITISP